MTRTLRAASELSEGQLRVGMLRAGSTITNSFDGEEMSVTALFNITQVPLLLLWPSGTGKRYLAPPIRLPADLTANVLSNGARNTWSTLRPIVPNIVQMGGATELARLFSIEAGLLPTLPRIFILSKVPGTSPMLKRLALDFSQRAVFVSVPPGDKELTAAFGLKAAPEKPRVFVSREGGIDAPRELKKGSKKVPLPAPAAFANWTTYDPEAPLKLGALRAWLENLLPPPAVQRVSTSADLEKACASSICFVGIVPSSAAGAATAQRALAHAATAASLVSCDFSDVSNAQSLKGQRTGATFVYIDGETNAAWASAFRVSAPGLVALNMRKKFFAPLQGTLTPASARDFVDSLLFVRPPGAPRTPAGDRKAWLQPPLDVRLEAFPTVVPELIASADEGAGVEVGVGGERLINVDGSASE